jgi:phosphatidylserine/phosphatidylglycerophosphate/cardiolipin synthase-like enzyme
MDSASKDGFHLKLWRGERMCLIGMDVDAPEPDFVGFAIEVLHPGGTEFAPLRNRLAFSYPAGSKVNGDVQFPSIEAPFQKFRWVHFPYDPIDGLYSYRVTKMHMPAEGSLVAGTQLVATINLNPVTHPGFLDIGFTRAFASSQAYRDKFGNRDDILPATNAVGLEFSPPFDPAIASDDNPYTWLGFEAAAIVQSLVDEAVADTTLTVDFFAYDLNLGWLVDRLEKLGPRLRAVIDDSPKDHNQPDGAEGKASARLLASTGGQIVRMHFKGLQHNKVIILRRNGVAQRVLLGSTNFSYRGFYIQANNALLFSDPAIAGLFGDYFDAAFHQPETFSASEMARKWYAFTTPGKPIVQIALSPHSDKEIGLSPVGAAIDQATSSVFFSIAFLNQTKSGSVRTAIDRLATRPIFSYGVVDKAGAEPKAGAEAKPSRLDVYKPDGTIAVVDFGYLAKNAPPPFGAEWQGGKGINLHNKFVVTDFGLPTAKVFTGSSNLSPSGEGGNGDHLVMIQDPIVATAYAIEAVRLFDHLHFRSKMKDAKVKPKGAKAGDASPLTLAKPTALSGKPAWFERYYRVDSQYLRDRLLFGH